MRKKQCIHPQPLEGNTIKEEEEVQVYLLSGGAILFLSTGPFLTWQYIRIRPFEH